MSNAPMGSGWWQASDGRWYPPQQGAPIAAPPGYGYYAGPASGGTSGKAIAALVLGIASLMVCYVGFIAGILGIVFALLAKRDIDREGFEGRGLATAGLVCGIIGTVLQLALDGLILVAVLASSSY
jgi:hypothetical protein